MLSQPGATDYAAWRERLATANDPAFWPIEALDALVSEGRGQFWCDGRAALVTHVVAYPGGAVALEAIAGAGNMRGLVEAIAPAVEQWAGSNGITHLKVAGRPGWERRLKGWRVWQSIMIKEL